MEAWRLGSKGSVACLATLLVVSLPVSAVAQSESAAAARTLTGLLLARHLDAIAARDAKDVDRFVAALFFPGSQLLVISARYGSPPRLQALLDHQQYREAYLELGSASIVDSKIFFQDLNADGLQPATGVGIYYERDSIQTIFDGDWKKHNMTERAYREKLVAADGQYARLLGCLAGALK